LASDSGSDAAASAFFRPLDKCASATLIDRNMFRLRVGDIQEEIPMRIAIALAIALVAVSPVAAAPSDPAAEPPPHPHRHHQRHHAVRPAPAASAHPNPRAETNTPAPAPEWPGFKPYPFGEGDEEGLSRDPDDCAKGCIGGNPG
jgi:hypothetical protein